MEKENLNYYIAYQIIRKCQPVTLKNLWKLKSSFVQINNKTKCSHINQQATEEMDIDLTKITPGNSQKPLAGVCNMVF